jgi:GDPmannose 4,6-dehydratase
MLSAEGKQVIGVIRSSAIVPEKYLHEKVSYLRGNILDPDFIYSLLEKYKPTHIYNLASASSVSESYINPQLSLDINLRFVKLLVDSIEIFRTKTGQDIFLLQASSSEMFGPNQISPITENTSHDPQNPYAEHKSISHNFCSEARTTKDLKIGMAILFNHESSRRPLKFVSRKITHGAFLISQGLEKKLILGNIKVQRDWGYAPDYVQAIKCIAQAKSASDYVVATGKLHSLEEMCRTAFDALGLGDFAKYVESDPSLYRKVENSGLVGLAEKMYLEFDWGQSVSFEEMIGQMVHQESLDTTYGMPSM